MKGGPVPLDGGVADTLETCSCSICFTGPNFITLQLKPFWRNYGNPPENVDPSRAAFQGHSRLLEPTPIDRLPVTSY